MCSVCAPALTRRAAVPTGESRLFMRRPELESMLHSDLLESIAPGSRVFTQLFMGYPHMGRYGVGSAMTVHRLTVLLLQ